MSRNIFLQHRNSLLCSNRNISQLNKFPCTAVEIFLYHTMQNSFQYCNRIISILPVHKFSCTAVEIFSYHTMQNSFQYNNKIISILHTTQILLHSSRNSVFATTPELLYSKRNISLLHKLSYYTYSNIKIFLIQQNSYTAIGIFPYHTLSFVQQ
jgi:hypothetical protein